MDLSKMSSLPDQQRRYMAARHLMTAAAVPSRPANALTNLSNVANMANTADGGESVGRKRRRRDRQPPPHPQCQSAHRNPKDHRAALAEEARALEDRVERLRLDVGLPTKVDRHNQAQARARNAEIEHQIYENTRYASQLHALATQQLQSPPVISLSTFIHLPCDQAQRRAILQGMNHVKLRRAAEVGIEHFRHLDGNASYLREERFTTEDGAYHCNRSEMNAFPNFHTAKQLYDALLFWIYNMEISVAELLNQIAVREDSTGSEIEPTIWNQRIVTTTEDIGCVEELNFVGFAQFYNSSELLDGAPLGVITLDTVDEDDLYPYKPLERTRKDIQASHVICEVQDLETQCKSVVLKSYYLNAQLAPEFPVEPRVIEKLHEYMSRWCVAIVHSLRECVVPAAVDCMT